MFCRTETSPSKFTGSEISTFLCGFKSPTAAAHCCHLQDVDEHSSETARVVFSISPVGTDQFLSVNIPWCVLHSENLPENLSSHKIWCHIDEKLSLEQLSSRQLRLSLVHVVSVTSSFIYLNMAVELNTADQLKRANYTQLKFLTCFVRFPIRHFFAGLFYCDRWGRFLYFPAPTMKNNSYFETSRHAYGSDVDASSSSLVASRLSHETLPSV